MRGLFYSLLGYFLTPAGLVLLGALDSSMVFFLPLGIDFIVILLTARKPELFWLYAILATVGSIIGAAGGVLVGRKGGGDGGARVGETSRLQSARGRGGGRAAGPAAA